jgi:hypothetical protein
MANENPASDQLEEKVDDTNYPGAPESQDVEGKESSQPEQTAKTEAPAKPDWRVEKYGEDWENTAAYWKDTSSYWREELKKKNARTFESLDEPESRTARSNQQTAVEPKGEVDPDEITSVKDLITHMRGEVEKTFDEKLSARQGARSVFLFHAGRAGRVQGGSGRRNTLFHRPRAGDSNSTMREATANLAVD